MKKVLALIFMVVSMTNVHAIAGLSIMKCFSNENLVGTDAGEDMIVALFKEDVFVLKAVSFDFQYDTAGAWNIEQNLNNEAYVVTNDGTTTASLEFEFGQDVLTVSTGSEVQVLISADDRNSASFQDIPFTCTKVK